MRRLVLLLAIVMTVKTLSPLPALGCSCMEILEPGPILDGAGGAFIGTMVEKHPHVPDEFSATYVFEVSQWRSEEHTSELQSRPHLVCRLLLEKKKKQS